MAKVIRIHQHGGPEALQLDEMSVGEPGPGEVRLRQTAIGLNYIDVYFRTGLYPCELPAVLGMEAAGVVEALGAGVDGLKIGDRVAYPMTLGAYAEQRVISAERLVALPDSISDRQAAGMMLKGLTAQYLLRRTYKVQPGDTILVYAAAGGVGSILCQWAKALGATIIGCVGSEAKAVLARENGCEHTILYNSENIPERVRQITGGEGVAVVYDSIGDATFEDSLNCLRPFGTMVSYGNATGAVSPFNIGLLAAKGSLFLTRPTLATHTATPALLQDGARELFDIVSSGKVSIAVNQVHSLADVSAAHAELEARATTGSTILVP